MNNMKYFRGYWSTLRLGRKVIDMKVKMVCQRDYETREVELPMDAKLLKV